MTLLSKIDIDHLAAIACGERLPGAGFDLLVDLANAAVAEADVDPAVHAPQGRYAPLPFATHVRAFIVEKQRAVEGALQKPAVHPACAAVAGNVLVAFEICDPRIRLEVLQSILVQQHV